MLTARTARPSSTSSRSFGDQRPSNHLSFKGLPLSGGNDYLFTFLDVHQIAKGKEGQPLISFLPVKEGHKFRSAKITFISTEAATVHLNQWNKKVPPGSSNKLTICYWKKPENESLPPKEPVKPTNSILIQGLPENIRVGRILSFVNKTISRGKSNQPLVQIFPAKNGYQSARVILTSIRDARDLIAEKNNKPLPECSNRLTIKYYAERPVNGRKFDEDMARRVRQAAAVGSQSVLIKGLFENCNDDYLISLIGHEKIAMGNKGRRLVTMFHSHASAKITFKSSADAREFITNYHQKTLPQHDQNKLTVEFYLEKQEQKTLKDPIITDERHSDKPRTIVRNVIYIQGIGKQYTNDQLKEIVEKKTGTKVSKIKIFRYADGKSEGRGTITYKDAADAQRCIKALNGKKMETSGVALKLELFQSTKVRRLEGAIGNDHLFGRNTTGSAYDCLACCETWDERDMLGCVPIKSQDDPEIHFLCQNCVRDYCESNKLDGRLGDHGTGFPCGQENCNRVLLWAPVNRVLTNRDTAARLDKRMTVEALRDIEGIEYCKEDCGYGAFLPDPQRMQFFSCQESTCMAQFCRICQIPYTQHIEKSCDEVDPRRRQEKETQRIKDEINEKLSLSQMVVCPKCSLRIGKDNGCNFMTCRCGCTMCYVCKQPNIIQSHFGPGGCRQNEDTKVIDERNLNQVLSAINADTRMRGLLSTVVDPSPRLGSARFQLDL